MTHEKVTFNQLRAVLLDLGYEENGNGSHVIFRHPDSSIYVILPPMKRGSLLRSIDLLSVRNALANSGMVPKDKFDSLFKGKNGAREVAPIELWHSIIDAEAEYHNEHGHPPHVLKLPVLQAYDLAKLRRSDFGDLAEKVMKEGIKVFEENGLLGIPVTLVPGAGEFEFE